MNAKIDIKTPAGKSLEGFPLLGYCDIDLINSGENKLKIETQTEEGELVIKRIELHQKDTITIEIL